MYENTIEEVIGSCDFVRSDSDTRIPVAAQTTYPVADHWPAWGGHTPASV